MKRLLVICIMFGALFYGVGVWIKNNPQAVLAYARDAERGRAGLTQAVVSIDGEAYPYLVGGSGPAVLLLHGFSGDKDNWTRFASHLTADYRVIAPDLPGFGETARHLDWSYDLASQRERLEGLVAAWQLEQPFHIVGNSMGGQLAGLYAHANPQRVLSIAFFDNSGVQSPQESEMAQALARGDDPLLVNSLEDFERMLAFVFVEPPPMPQAIKQYFATRAVKYRDFNAKIFADYRRGGGRSSALEPLLKDIRQPALVLWGDTDRLIHVSTTQVMQRKLPQPTVVIMEKCGHSPMIERPEETARHYRAFLQQQGY